MTDAELIAVATTVRENAFAPYSGFRVGAALLGANGQCYTGCNVESASYGLTMCAERVAIGKGVSDGCRHFNRVVIVTDVAKLTPPCGACRQLLWEFAPKATVVLVNLAGTRREYTMLELIPHAFDGGHLAAGS
jgi:cytidine deaminase